MNDTKLTELNTLQELLDNRRYSSLMREIDEIPPMDAAEFLTSLPQEKIPFVFRLLKKDTAAEIFAELDTDFQETIVQALSDREIGEMLEELAVDDAVDMLEEMPATVVKRILKNASKDTRAELNRFLAYPEDSAGSVMTSEFLHLHERMTCAEAIAKIRSTGLEKETVYVAYVTDRARVLCGVVDLRDLLFSDADAKIADIMDTRVIFAGTHDDRETVADLISHYDLIALPIVDKENRLVGIVTVDDALDVLEAEATEDIERMAAISPADKPYLKTGVLATWKKRIPWLLILMLSGAFTSSIITHYENAIGTYAILSAFFPMLMSTGGNAGGQTSATIIRGLSLGEITMKDTLRVLWKELRVSLLCGLTLSAATFIKVYAVDFRFHATTLLENGTTQNNLLITGIICATVFFAVPVAKLVGTLLPIGAKRVGLDPTVMASPFITTIVDIVVLILYFNIAAMILPF